jgi:WD40 repeat protein
LSLFFLKNFWFFEMNSIFSRQSDRQNYGHLFPPMRATRFDKLSEGMSSDFYLSRFCRHAKDDDGARQRAAEKSVKIQQFQDVFVSSDSDDDDDDYSSDSDSECASEHRKAKRGDVWVRRFNENRKVETLFHHKTSVSDLSFLCASNDKYVFASADMNGVLALFSKPMSMGSASTLLCSNESAHKRRAVNRCVSLGKSELDFVTCGDDGFVRLWQAIHGRVVEIRAFAGHASFANACDAHADGKRLASASTDHSIRLWDVDLPRSVATINAHVSAHCDVRFVRGAGAAHLLLVSTESGIDVWDLRSVGKPLDYVAVDISTSSSSSSSSNNSGRRRHDDIENVWQPTTGNLDQQSLWGGGSWSRPSSLSSSLWGGGNWQRQLSTTTTTTTVQQKQTKLLFNVECKEPIGHQPIGGARFCREMRRYLMPFRAHTASSPIYALTPSSDGRHVITSGSGDSQHNLWALERASSRVGVHSFTGADLSGYVRPVLSADDSLLVSGSMCGSIFAWRTFATDSDRPASARHNCAAIVANAHRFSISALAVSPCGSLIVSADYSGAIAFTSLQ